MINIIKLERSQFQFMEEEAEKKPIPGERNGKRGGSAGRQGGGLKQSAPSHKGGRKHRGGGLEGGGRRYFF